MSRKAPHKKATTNSSSVSASKKEKLHKLPIEKRSMLNGLLVLAAILPVFFSWETMDPSLAIRYVLLSTFVLLFLLYFYGWRKKLVAGWPLLIKIVFIAGIAYGVWNIFALFSAVNKQQVYYGLGRHFLNLLLLFIITEIATREEKYLLRICKLLSIAAILHALIGLCQFYDVAFTTLPGNFKPYGLMGNRNLYGSAQVLLLPFVIFVLYQASRAWKYVGIIALTGIAASAILSQTRSSWLAGITISVVALLLVMLFSPGNRKKWLIGTVAGFAGIVALFFLLVASDTEGEFSASVKERTSNIFSATDSTDKTGAADNVKERLKIWSKTSELIKDNWLLGVGPGNWRIVVAKYGSEGLAWAKGKYIPDSPHNDYLLVAAESGLPGAVMYIAMWVMIALIAFKTIVKALTEERRMLNIVMLSGLTGFAVDSLFSFPSERFEHSLYVYLMAGIILGTFINNAATTVTNQQAGKLPASGRDARMKKWQLALFVAIAAFNLLLAQKKYSFEKHLLLSKKYEETGAFQQAIEEGNKGRSSLVSIPPNGFPIQTYIGLAQKGLKNYPAAFKEMEEAIKLHPYNKALFINKGTIFSDMAQYDSAIKYYNYSLSLTPAFDIIYFNLALSYYQLKNYKAVVEMLNKTDIGNNQQLLNIKQESERQVAAQNQQQNTPAPQQ